ncbi:hypothetical protein EDD85DRAFT_955820 [Armillaria nabsnona]|nr:hypothetical protein EDD85DRAFT_955820 [Armillaria nabsnona]
MTLLSRASTTVTASASACSTQQINCPTAIPDLLVNLLSIQLSSGYMVTRHTPSCIIPGSRAPGYLNGATTVKIAMEHQAQCTMRLCSDYLEICGHVHSKAPILDINGIDAFVYEPDTVFFGLHPQDMHCSDWKLIQCRLYSLLDSVNTAVYKQRATVNHGQGYYIQDSMMYKDIIQRLSKP